MPQTGGQAGGWPLVEDMATFQPYYLDTEVLLPRCLAWDRGDGVAMGPPGLPPIFAGNQEG